MCNAVNHRRMSRPIARKRKLKVQLHFWKRQRVLFFAVMLSSKYKEGIPVAIAAELKHRAGAHSLHHFAAPLSLLEMSRCNVMMERMTKREA